ncbi:RluA family pseudouridine synthase [uncultured Peptoniphilus sp.]|uniref:RluA family pseudouridine synthase n=1 Tax=uncultured Peptoniphilus sp. TaxID=254354 RepID=UPI0026356EFE|nr:RluA family pseudouridine synthase [uncultured Peptoniphilus sp.]
MYKNTFVVSTLDVDSRLDKFLDQKLEINRSQIKNHIESGNILLNGKIVKAGYSLRKGDTITVSFEDEEKLLPENIDFNTIYEDEYLAVISKPQDLVVHPGAGNKSGTLVNALLYKFKNLSNPIDEDRPGIVHRLDKDTSGLMIIAKKDEAYYKLVEMFKNREIEKHYLAIVHGNIYEDFDVDAPIGRDPNNRVKMKVVEENSKNAFTSFHVLKNFDKFTLLDVTLHTGRTHQIRVHLSYVNHPVVGDETYGIKNKYKINKQLLHAYKLKFIHPITGEELEIVDEFPKRFTDFMAIFSKEK